MGSPEEPLPQAKPTTSRPLSVASTPPSAQESPSMPVYTTDWAASAQAYYSAGPATPPAFFPPIWGGQHLMAPYGTPIAYSPIYHPGAVYAHPFMAPGMGFPIAELGNIMLKGAPRKSEEGEKATSGLGEEDVSQRSSGGSGTEGSSNNRDESTVPQSGRAPKLPVSAPGRTTLPGPATNLNIGMDIWNKSHEGSAALEVRPLTEIAPPAAVGIGTIADCRLVQEERESKRERRKQSNRESARRSRLRKLHECDELARKVAELNDENSALRMELEQLHKVCKDLEAENQHIVEELSSIL